MWNLAQVNIGRIVAPTIDDQVMKEFVQRLDDINRLAECSPGFVWRLKTLEGDATSIKYNDDNRIIINMSVWKKMDDLQAFVYKSRHREVLAKRKQWFEPMKFFIALWYIPKFSFPSVEDARFRLEYLENHGASPMAFTFAKPFQQESARHF